MKWYADDRGRLVRQVVFDLAVLVWIVVWVFLAMHVRTRVLSVQGGTQRLQDGASTLSTNMTDAGNKITSVPLVGDGLKKPFTDAADAATQVSLAGKDMTVGVGQMGSLLAYLVAVTPIAIALLVWVLVRLRYARRAGRARAVAVLPGGIDLLALQALQHASPTQLRTLQAPSDGWRRMNVNTIERLARLELDTLGLRPPK